jgi:uncharacterized cupin superfamily protein
VGLTHYTQAPSFDVGVGHLGGRWTLLGEAAGSQTVGLRRIELPAGMWSTPAHEHGRSEEIFFVLAGSGISWQAGATAAIGTGDCIVYHPHGGAHTIRADDRLDVLAFGTREHDESPGFHGLELSLVGGRAVESSPATVDGVPTQFVREAELGPPREPPEPGPRPPTVVNLDVVQAQPVKRPRVDRIRRRISAQAGSRRAGLQHVQVAPGMESTAQHCHSLEEEVFVILDGDGTLVLDEQETPVRAGHVVARPAGTGVAHLFRASDGGLTYLAYGTREPGDVCYYPRSNKIAFRGVGIMARLEPITDYWDGED